MYLHYKARILSDPKYLSYFIPINIVTGRIFPVTAHSLDKKGIELESFQYTLNETYQNLFLCFENRFWLYGGIEGFKNQEFSFCFQALDKPNKAVLYSKRKKKLLGYSSFFSKLKVGEQLLKGTKRDFLVKSRLLRLTKGGFVSSFMDNPAVILRSSSFYKFRKHLSYRGWFSLNLSYYGLLSFFSVIHFERRVVSSTNKSQQKNLSKKFPFYFLRNKTIKYLFVLGKPKIF
jgi:hypothetical protein